MRVEATLAGLTWRLLLGRRRWLAVVACNGLPVFIAWLASTQIRAGEVEPEMAVAFIGVLMATLVLTGLLPLTALVFGTTAFGQEIEDGTLAYLLAKPTPRWRLVVVKLVVGAAATIVTIVPGTIAAGWIILGSPFHPLILGLAVGFAVAALLYSGIFMTLSLFTRRALILGLLYMIGWEGSVSRLLVGLRTLSVREYATAVSEAVAGQSLPGPLDSPLEASTATWMSVMVLGVALWFAIRKIREIELVEEV